MDFIRLDKVSAREDGGVVMYVESVKPLDNSIKTQEYLRDKIEMCLDYIKTKEFYLCGWIHRNNFNNSVFIPTSQMIC